MPLICANHMAVSLLFCNSNSKLYCGRSCMKVFQFAEKRTRVRIQEAKAVGYFPFPMHLFLYTPSKFKSCLQKYKAMGHSGDNTGFGT